MNDGYIKMNRSIMNSKIWCNADATTFKVFLYCLMKANFKDKTVNGIKIEKGSFLTSKSRLANELHMSKNTVLKALRKLVSINEISIETTSKWTKIIIINYLELQGCTSDSGSKIEQEVVQNLNTSGSKNEQVKSSSGSKNEQEVVQNLNTSGSKNEQVKSSSGSKNEQEVVQDLTPTNNDKKNDINNNKKEREERETPFPPSLSDVIDYASSIGYSEAKAKEFHDYYTSCHWKTTKGNRVSDWKAKLKQWKRNEKDDQSCKKSEETKTKESEEAKDINLNELWDKVKDDK